METNSEGTNQSLYFYELLRICSCLLNMDPPSPDDTPSSDASGYEYEDIDTAFHDRDVDKVSELANAMGDKFEFSWLTLAIWKTEDMDPKLRNDLCAVLLNSPPREGLCKFLHHLLKNTKKEQTPLLILEKYPDLFIEEMEGDCAFRLAASNGKLEVLNMVLKLVKQNSWQECIIPAATGVTSRLGNPRRLYFPEGITILDLAAEKGHIDIVKALVTFEREFLDHGHPLHAAVYQCRLDVARYLLSEKVELVESFTPEPNSRSVFSVGYREEMRNKVSEKIDMLLFSTMSRVSSPAMIRKLVQGSRGISLLNQVASSTQLTMKS